MKKGKKTMMVTIGLACFALSCIMFMQFKIVNQTDITSIETMRETELRTELANWKEKYQKTDEQYKEVEQMIQEYKDKKQSNNETTQLVESELKEAEQLLGKTNMQGEGIEITIKETGSEEVPRITADDLIVIVNSLKFAGAEAISINEERILTMSDIVDINDSFIKINGQRVLAPYVIKAIGNKSYLEGSLLGTGGYVEKLKNIGHNVAINQSNKVEVKKYNGDINYKYISD